MEPILHAIAGRSSTCARRGTQHLPAALARSRDSRTRSGAAGSGGTQSYLPARQFRSDSPGDRFFFSFPQPRSGRNQRPHQQASLRLEPPAPKHISVSSIQLKPRSRATPLPAGSSHRRLFLRTLRRCTSRPGQRPCGRRPSHARRQGRETRRVPGGAPRLPPAHLQPRRTAGTELRSLARPCREATAQATPGLPGRPGPAPARRRPMGRPLPELGAGPPPRELLPSPRAARPEGAVR